MANTTFANLKINALHKAGNNYNASDATKILIAGGIINDVLGFIGTQIKGHPYTLATGKTVSTVASQAYVALTDTDILELLQFYQQTTNTKLRQITWEEYVQLVPNTSVMGGIPDMLWAPIQAVNGSGVNIWTVYFLPTPSSVISMTYDYIKSLKFSVDTTAADAEFCKLPSTFDDWIYQEFKPRFYEIIDSTNRARIQTAKESAMDARKTFKDMIMSQADRVPQVNSRRGYAASIYKRVQTTTVPS